MLDFLTGVLLCKQNSAVKKKNKKTNFVKVKKNAMFGTLFYKRKKRFHTYRFLNSKLRLLNLVSETNRCY